MSIRESQGPPDAGATKMKHSGGKQILSCTISDTVVEQIKSVTSDPHVCPLGLESISLGAVVSDLH